MSGTVFLLVLAVIAAVPGYAATRPGTFEVRRSTRIRAPAERIFAIVNDFHNWSQWSPYDGRDPAMVRVFSGAASGAGAVYEWNGNSKVGRGRIEITDAVAPSRLTMTLDMLKPFVAHNIVNYTFDGRGEETEVTWALQGPVPFMSKLIGLFVNMDKMVGDDFVAGLSNLKAVAENGMH
jgi:uncharacterized protein YndB with AHSA1/START domain